MHKTVPFWPLWPLLCLTFMCQASPARADHTARLYDKEDLSILVQQQDWAELLMHIKDVPPRQRDAAWVSLVEKAALARLHELVQRNDDATAYQVAESLLENAATLKRSRPFMDLRGEVAARYHTNCLRHRGGFDCLPAIRGTLNTDPQNRTLAIQLAKTVRINLSSSAAAEIYLPVMKRGDALCNDEELKRAVKSALNLPGDSSSARAGIEIATHLCFQRHKKLLLEMLYASGRRSSEAKNICPALQKKKLLTPFLNAFCNDVAEVNQ